MNYTLFIKDISALFKTWSRQTERLRLSFPFLQTIVDIRSGDLWGCDNAFQHKNNIQNNIV